MLHVHSTNERNATRNADQCIARQGTGRDPSNEIINRDPSNENDDPARTGHDLSLRTQMTIQTAPGI